MFLFNIDQTTDICYNETGGQRLCYVDFGLDSRDVGVPLCTKVRGQLPNVYKSGRVNFLQNTFGTDYWISLTAYARYVCA